MRKRQIAGKRSKMRWMNSIIRWHRVNCDNGYPSPTHVFSDGTVFFGHLAKDD